MFSKKRKAEDNYVNNRGCRGVHSHNNSKRITTSKDEYSYSNKNYENILKSAVKDFDEIESNQKSNLYEYFNNFKELNLGCLSHSLTPTNNEKSYTSLLSEDDCNLEHSSIHNEEEKLKSLLRCNSLVIKIGSEFGSENSLEDLSLSSISELISERNDKSMGILDFCTPENNSLQNIIEYEGKTKLQNFEQDKLITRKTDCQKYTKTNFIDTTIKKYFKVAKMPKEKDKTLNKVYSGECKMLLSHLDIKSCSSSISVFNSNKSDNFPNTPGTKKNISKTSSSQFICLAGTNSSIILAQNEMLQGDTNNRNDPYYSTKAEKISVQDKSQNMSKQLHSHTSTESLAACNSSSNSNKIFSQNSIPEQTHKHIDYLKGSSCMNRKSDTINLVGFNSEHSNMQSKLEFLQKEHKNLDAGVTGSMTESCLDYEHKLKGILKISVLPEVNRILQEGLNKISHDETLIYDPSLKSDGLPEAIGVNEIKRKIEKIFSKILTDAIEQRSGPVLKIRNIKWNNCVYINNRLKLNNEDPSYSFIRYKNSSSQVNFNIIVFLLGKIFSLLQTGATCTKREIFYQIVNYIEGQDKIDNAINSVSCLLNVPPWELGILASSKGLVYGDLEIELASGHVVKYNIKGGALIPQNPREISNIKTSASFILVVEKDSIYQKLLDEKLPHKFANSFILITGKGYPDVNTRLFLKVLWMMTLKPAFIIVDADPDGVDIMLTYRFGSLSCSHLCDYLAVPSLRWLGVHPSEILSFGIKNQLLSQKDRRKIKSLLNRPYFYNNNNVRIRKEIEILQEKNTKAEIEGVMKTDSFLTNIYLPNKLFINDYF